MDKDTIGEIKIDFCIHFLEKKERKDKNMQITLLSVLTVVLTILKCHNVVTMDWWIVFSPAVADLFFGFVRKAAERRRAEMIYELLNGINEDDKEDY